MLESSLSSAPIPLLTRLREFVGRYQGAGTNHTGDRFEADFLLDEAFDGALIEIRFRARDGENSFHEERTWITEDLVSREIGLWTVSNNTPGVLRLPLVEDVSDGSYLSLMNFRFGDPSDQTQFREQIQIGLRHDRAIEYVYSWGVPHDAFQPRSRTLLRRLM